MAGDWIKVEVTTPDKPEVIQIAATLGIDQDTVVGKLLRVWIWADQQTVNGNAVSVTKAFLDRITAIAGFADAMQKAGWLAFHDSLLLFPNFDRHNGKTAKKRALIAARVRKLRENRNADVTPPELQKEARSSLLSSSSGSLKEEGGGAGGETKPAKPKRVKTPLADDSIPKEKFDEMAADPELAAGDLAWMRRQYACMRDHFDGEGKKNWTATFRNWLRRARFQYNDAPNQTARAGGKAETSYERDLRILAEV